MSERNCSAAWQSLCTPLYSYAKRKGLEPIPNGLALSKFSDCGSISDWASDAVSWAAGVNYFGTDRRVGRCASCSDAGGQGRPIAKKQNRR